ncbi:MAG: hypothetical protein IH608_11125 [Proteobacteria bacterium]|nr:hypothetical protein [Pseudomonadota bacterium]
MGAVFAGEADRAGPDGCDHQAGARLEDLPFDPLDRRAHWGRYAFHGWEAGRREGWEAPGDMPLGVLAS